ncbi:MAG: hypothetical protein WAL25_14410 [Acidimicrobiia bacterium]
MSDQPLEPIDPRDAFTVTPRLDSETTQSVAASQAALLLATRAGVLGQETELAELEEEVAPAPFELPELRAVQRSRRIPVAEAVAPLAMSRAEMAAEPSATIQDEMARKVHDLYQRPSFEDAAALFEAALYSPHPLVAVAAAAGARETTRLRPHIRVVLEENSGSDDPLVAELAQEVLSQIEPKNTHLQERVVTLPPSKKRRRNSRTAAITHGTWAAQQDWYKPTGDFYGALKANRPDLAVHDQSFTWSGSYSHGARRVAARELKQWVANQGLVSPDLFAHSHGGTVANLATEEGVAFDKLVLLAWPVHDQWRPDFGRVGQVYDIRVRFDLVILVDGGRQRFRDPQVKEHRNGWFDHAAPHQPAYWNAHGLWAFDSAP